MTYLNSAPAEGIEILEGVPVPTAVSIAHEVALTELNQLFDATFSALGQAIALGKIRPAGPAVCRYVRMNEPQGTCDVEVGFPVPEALPGPLAMGSIELVASEIPAARLARSTHLGSYDRLPAAWETMMTTLAEQGYRPAGSCFEVYVTEPTPQADPATMRTDLYCPVAQ
ncbi:GyrI-like domain-containing protein [Staphylococcus chromogenes]|nr:GyrI-like domain-containing protein [Staphylococcus chromogenes]